jgi:pimeloyl-ACP methyl ester carboxylesterase
MFETATHRFIQGVNGVTIHTVVMGEGEPLLLLHGHPETYLMWHKVAGDLAHRFTVVMCDLRGYGDSDKPEGLPDHSTYSKRIMAEDCIAVMGKLGFDRFSVMGHDRGARVAVRANLGPGFVRRVDIVLCGKTDHRADKNNQQVQRVDAKAVSIVIRHANSSESSYTLEAFYPLAQPTRHHRCFGIAALKRLQRLANRVTTKARFCRPSQ